jgi:hypothetical protein
MESLVCPERLRKVATCTDWRDFFDRHEDYRVETYFYECRGDFTMEELYQAFKARLEHEREIEREEEETGDR